MKLNHFELCKSTAKRFAMDNMVTIFDYQYLNIYSNGFPDVLCFGKSTTLYEIKISRVDFLKDKNKDARIKYKPKGNWRLTKKHIMEYVPDRPELWYIEQPHLGLLRYFVCEKELISVDELPDGWGLYWLVGNKFYLKKESGKFKRDIYSEMRILMHAFRNWSMNKKENIIVKSWDNILLGIE